ncbi:DMT family transporter [Spirosoma luteum]|uniref:DMT family transporter n=1 Tax=Spirosoma luteum TaxID=431553 RepID=UPI000362386B|nr:SMR family transporter [Spirosoma luteum]
MTPQTILSWLYLIGAAISQTAWAYSIKYIRWEALKALRWSTFYQLGVSLPALLPWIGYVVFGIVNTVLLAAAMRTIPTTTAFAVWMGLSLIFLKAADVIWLKLSWSWSELFFILLITISIVGLKLSGPAD